MRKAGLTVEQAVHHYRSNPRSPDSPARLSMANIATAPVVPYASPVKVDDCAGRDSPLTTRLHVSWGFCLAKALSICGIVPTCGSSGHRRYTAVGLQLHPSCHTCSLGSDRFPLELAPPGRSWAQRWSRLVASLPSRTLVFECRSVCRSHTTKSGSRLKPGRCFDRRLRWFLWNCSNP